MGTHLFPPGDPEVLYVVDLSSYVLRAYHAIGELSSPSGEPTHATFGTVSMLERLVRERRPALLAVAMDSGRDTFRRELYPEYKATRPPAPDDLKVQFGRCQEIIEAFAIPVLKEQGIEADDLIAAAVRDARRHGLKVVIVGADKDLMQLVGADVVMWDTMRDRVFGVPEVEERFGVRVDQVRDLLALMGDTSDNVPGVPHVGPKTARDLLVEFGTLEGVYANLDKITKKALRQNLEQHRDQALISQKLVTLKDDSVIDFDLGALRWGGRDVERLKRLYGELGFLRQLHALQSEADAAPTALRPSSPSPSPGPAIEVTTTCVLDEGGLRSLAEAIRASGCVAVAAQTAEHSPLSPLAGIALSPADGVGYYVPIAHRALGTPRQLSFDEVKAALGAILADASVHKLAHCLKHETVVLAWNGLSLVGGHADVQLDSYLLDPERRNDLESIAERELGVVLPDLAALTRPARGKRLDFDQVPLAEATRYAALRAEATLRAAERSRKRVLDEGLGTILDEIELPLSSVLAEMELGGVLIDSSRLAELGGLCRSELARLEAEAHRLAGRAFNLASPRQLEVLLFDELGLTPLRRTQTSRSTDADTLEALADEHPLPKVILEHRQVAKLKGTYIDALPSLVNPRTGRVHTSWEQAVAATGRLSSTDPNLQNIPIRSELGREIRGAFIAPPGHSIVSADYSQIELRVLAHLSKDPVLCDAFRSGQDVHTRTAMEVFEVDAAAVTPEMRRRAKAVNFGVIYGQGDSGLSKSLGIPRAEASSFIAAYFRRYEGVRRFMNATLDGARASEAVHTLSGRRRMVPDIQSGNRQKRLAAERIAMNAPIQGTAADILKLAMLCFRTPPTPGARMVLTVHDELVFEVPDSEVDAAKAKVKAAMEAVLSLDVPLAVDVGAGKTWKDAH
ncbi:MAG: DNA polymerase I [Polyangiaceae bacterium]|nr:DNA polymerase I [Polyangiaceae bacterium]